MSMYRAVGLVSLLLFCSLSFAWLDGWDYRMPVEINNTASVLTDHQVNLSIPYDTHMQADFDDLRFALADGTELAYWLESKVDSDNAKV